MAARPRNPANTRSARLRRWIMDALLRREVLFAIGAVLSVAGATYLATQSLNLTPRGMPMMSDSEFHEKYCEKTADEMPGLIVARPSIGTVNVDATMWSMLSPDQRRAFVSATGCVAYGHPMTAGDRLIVVSAPAQAIVADANGATIRLLD
jgi:hypothetical protein